MNMITALFSPHAAYRPPLPHHPRTGPEPCVRAPTAHLHHNGGRYSISAARPHVRRMYAAWGVRVVPACLTHQERYACMRVDGLAKSSKISNRDNLPPFYVAGQVNDAGRRLLHGRALLLRPRLLGYLAVPSCDPDGPQVRVVNRSIPPQMGVNSISLGSPHARPTGVAWCVW